MWIERIELIGFGNALNEKVDMGVSGITFVEESKEHSSLLLPAAVLAVLHGRQEDLRSMPLELSDINRFRPKGQTVTAFVVKMNCSLSGRRITISRNLNDNSLTVCENSDERRNVTAEYVVNNRLSLGEKITDLGSDAFFSQCMVMASPFEKKERGCDGVREIIDDIVSANSPSHVKATAVDVLEKQLNQFLYKSIEIKIEFLIEELEKQKLELARKCEALKDERKKVVPLLTELTNVSVQREPEMVTLYSEEYFRLCIRTAEIDGTMLKLRSQHVRCRSMEEELARIGTVDAVFIDMQSQVEDLWTYRSQKIDEYQRLEQQLLPQIANYETNEIEVTKRWEKLQTFTPEQAHSLKAMAERFMSKESELSELTTERVLAENRAKQLNIDMSKYEEVKRTILSLDERAANDAKSYSSLIFGFRKQLASSERGKSRAEATIAEIEEQRRAKAEDNAMLSIFKPTALRGEELESAKEDLVRHQDRIKDLKERIFNLESRIQGLAHKAGIADGAALLKRIEEYAAADPQLHELERLDHLIGEKQRLCDELEAEFMPYFKQAGRLNDKITAESVSQLAANVLNCLRDFKAINSTFTTLKAAKKELESCASEIRTAEKTLKVLFGKAHFDKPQDIEGCYSDFYGEVAKFHHRQVLVDELAKSKEKYGFAPGSEQIYKVLADLEQERIDSWKRIHDIVDQFPWIIDQLPPMSGPDSEIKKPSQQFERLTKEEGVLICKIKELFANYDEKYLPLLSRIDLIDRDLTKAKNTKMALELAREVLEQLLIDDLTKVYPSSSFDQAGSSESLPLIIDAGILPKDELEFFLVLRFLINVIAPKRQTIVLVSSKKLRSTRFSAIINASPVPANIAFLTPIDADNRLKPTYSD